MRHGWAATATGTATATATAGLILLAGCGQYENQPISNDAVAVELVAPSAPGAPGPTPTPAAAPSVAYVYRYTLELPAARTVGLMTRHERACIDAGPAVCQIIGSESNRYGRDSLTASLQIRAIPAWIARFRGDLAGEAGAAGGRIASSGTESEDLTRQLVDTEAQLRAKTTLRDRLQQLLATRNGSLEELLKVERELAQVQGEIDATQSGLVAMRTRVATSRLDIDYRSEGQIATDSVFRPVTDALRAALTVFMTSVGALITIAAVVLPFALIATPLVWWILRQRSAAKRLRRAEGAQAARGASPET